MLGGHPLIILLLKSTIFSLSETRITSLFSLVILRVVVGFFILTSQLYYIPGCYNIESMDRLLGLGLGPSK